MRAFASYGGASNVQCLQLFCDSDTEHLITPKLRKEKKRKEKNTQVSAVPQPSARVRKELK